LMRSFKMVRKRGMRMNLYKNLGTLTTNNNKDDND
jgi:hypothetical protein